MDVYVGSVVFWRSIDTMIFWIEFVSASPNFCSNETCLILVSLASATRPTEPPTLVKLCDLPHLLAHTCFGKLLQRVFCYCPCPSSAPKWKLASIQPEGSCALLLKILNSLSENIPLANWPTVASPKRMNFRKSPKRPLNPASFSENYVAIFIKFHTLFLGPKSAT